ncbi:uncharacterized protein LOC127923901 [Oncorhynchus keta]|uniref:uncharacterized protein LOC127923901 n=1 Tax=Oncorhynchus keta TaxID=8018 RepID=UPI00227BA0B9|nr:uncharacterized protein LOC127923901 [Oncorhynchus keta]
MSAQEFASDFRTLATSAGWNDKAQIDHYCWEVLRLGRSEEEPFPAPSVATEGTLLADAGEVPLGVEAAGRALSCHPRGDLGRHHVHLQRDMRRQRPVVAVPIQESEVRRFLRPFWTSRCPALPFSAVSVRGRRCPVGEDCISVGGTSLCADPCLHYTVLNDAWRSTTNNGNVNGEHCDQSINWQGWYRLFLGDTSVQMPEVCGKVHVWNRCPMWLTEPHPQLLDGVVQRGVCGHWFSECCRFRENPIHVKACYGNYYVYKFVPPTQCNLAYCADVNTKVCSTCGVFDACVSDDKINWRCERKALELVCGPNFIQVGLQMVNLEAGRLDPSSGHLADPSCSAPPGDQQHPCCLLQQLICLPIKCKKRVSLPTPEHSILLCLSPGDREQPGCGHQTLPADGGWSFRFSAKAESFMSLYRNANFTERTHLEKSSCQWALPCTWGVSVDETYDQCPSDHHQVRVEESGWSLRARFSALLFLYQGDYRDVFLHCRLSLCDQRSSSCTRLVLNSSPSL